jgi:hypothetical protein
MKTEKLYIRIIALTVVLLTAVNSVVISQGTDSRARYAKEEKLFVGIVITPQTSKISNKDFSASGALNQKGGASLGFALEGGYFFSKMVGVTVGAGMGSFSSELSMDSCSVKFQTKDTDEETYEMRIKGKSITEKQKISYLSVPVCALIRIPSGAKLEFFVKSGLSFNIPVIKTYEGNGKFSYSGYYSAYPVLLENIPNYFPSNVSTTSSDNLELKPFTILLAAGGGASYKVNESINVSFGLNFNISLGNISAYGTNSDYRISTKPNEMLSIMGGTTSAGVHGLGISLGVKYFIR